MFIIFYPFSKVRRIRSGGGLERWRSKEQLIDELTTARCQLRALLRRSMTRDGGARAYNQERLRMLVHLATELAGSGDAEHAGRAVLQALCAGEGWSLGGIWLVEDRPSALRFDAMWHASDVAPEPFGSQSRASRIAPGQGLLGRIWQSGAPIWFFEIDESCGSGRAASLASQGMRWVYYFPIHDGVRVRGVFEFYGATALTPDEALLRTVRAAGKMLVQSLARIEVEARRGGDGHASEAEDYALLHLGADGRIVAWNQEAERLWGYGPDEAMALQLRSLYPAEHLPAATWALASALQEGQAHLVGLLERKDGSRFWGDVLVVPVRAPSGHLLGFTTLVHAVGEPCT